MYDLVRLLQITLCFFSLSIYSFVQGNQVQHQSTTRNYVLNNIHNNIFMCLYRSARRAQKSKLAIFFLYDGTQQVISLLSLCLFVQNIFMFFFRYCSQLFNVRGVTH